MRRALLFCAAFLLASGCSEDPTSVMDGIEPSGNELILTQGLAAPVNAVQSVKPSFSSAAVATNLGGSSSTPLSLTPQTCPSTASQQVTITYTVTGRQDNPASFKVNTQWSFNGTSWAGSNPVTVNVATRPTGPGSDNYPVSINVANASATSTGTSTLSVAPFDLVTSAPAALSITGASVTIHVAFAACAVTNTEPTLVVPDDITSEASSSAGAVVNFLVTASDLEDGDLSGDVTCDYTSGSTFPLGETTVSCSVTDGGGLSASGSFKIKVQDTTAPSFTAFPTNQSLIAADINGAVLDLSSLTITAADFGNVSPPVSISCQIGSSDADGYLIAIGTTVTVSCTATDASQYPSPNASAAQTFDVFVGLAVNGSGFLPPLRMIAPYSVHKRGSTVPHKFLPPTYADGTPATDLAGGLRLVLKNLDNTVGASDIEVNDYSAGSTEWRYDALAGQYIFNAKTGTGSPPWFTGTWQTTVSYAGIVLATTDFDLRK